MAKGQFAHLAQPHPTEETICYEREGVTFVPHFSVPDVFVAPGYGRAHMTTFTASHLLRNGARQVFRHLWVRPK